MRIELFNLELRGGMGVATLMLCACVPLDAQSSPEVIWMTNAHLAPVTSVAFSGDGSRLASGSQDRTAKAWLLPETTLLRTINTPSEWVLSVALSANGLLLATGGDEGKSRMWRMSDGGLQWIAGASENNLIRTGSFSADGSRFADASWSSDDIIVRDPVTGMGVHFSDHQGAVYSVVFSPDGSKLASASGDGTAKIWRISDGVTLHTLTGHSFFNPTNEDETVIYAVNSVDFSPDGTLLATAGADGTAQLWQVADGTRIRVLDGGGGNARFSADGKLLLTVSGGTIKVWRVADGYLLHSYTNANAGPLAVASNGKYLAYGRDDGALVLARMPLWIESIAQTNGAITLQWQGGSGNYQVQARNSLSTGQWQNLGVPTTNTVFTHTCLSPIFYRVQSLPTP